MRIQVAYVGPEAELLVALDVLPGTRVAEACAQSGILTRIEAPHDTLGYAIFGRRVDAAAELRDGDRIEITRPLRCDPKLARRRRAARQG
ncbi:MAG TPA: RnfH family protein [Casimicrobiaceae bacterium]